MTKVMPCRHTDSWCSKCNGTGFVVVGPRFRILAGSPAPRSYPYPEQLTWMDTSLRFELRYEAVAAASSVLSAVNVVAVRIEEFEDVIGPAPSPISVTQ